MLENELVFLFRRLGYHDHLSDDEKQALLNAAGRTATHRAGSDIAIEGTNTDYSTLLTSGIAARYNLLKSGERQITAFHVAGDFVDLHGFLLTRLDHSITAVSDITTVQFPHQNLIVLTEKYPHLTRMLWFSTLLDGAIHRRWLVAMGRMSAIAHTAHLFCEHFIRSQVAGLARENTFPFPVTQTTLADALGLSPVHVNRTVQELRRRELINWDGETVEVLDWAALQELAEFDPTFLDVSYRRR